MKICLIMEGSYPYVFGGVSSWTHQLIQAMPEHEFVLWCIGAKSEDRGKFKFELPENVTKVQEVFLDDALALKSKKSTFRLKLNNVQKDALYHLLVGEKTDWDALFELIQGGKKKPMDILMSEYLIDHIIQICKEKYIEVPFAEFFYTVRSMLLPPLYLLSQEIPDADIYHATATGYSGLLGSIAAYQKKRPFILTEHGIYTREREEELLRAKWVQPYFRKQWIQLFYLFSDCAYQHAYRVTSLFLRASQMQKELGCPKEKLRVIPNGVHFDRFCNIPLKEPNGYIDIGAIVRIAKIKDIKTMIYAFAEVKERVKNARLHIMGDIDDETYAKECKQLVTQLEIPDLIFTGVVNIVDYIKKLDFTILTSISEGQPLSILESFAAGRPCVVTDVGCCRELIEGNDEFKAAGVCVPAMHKEKIAKAIIHLCKDQEMRENMGQEARKRAGKYYTQIRSIDQYKALYEEAEKWQG